MENMAGKLYAVTEETGHSVSIVKVGDRWIKFNDQETRQSRKMTSTYLLLYSQTHWMGFRF
jgi:ubiquitin C-terminal hydrolase